MNSYNPFDRAAQDGHQDTQPGQPKITFIKARSRHYDETIDLEEIIGIQVQRVHLPASSSPPRVVVVKE
jgi:hypothetical protein